MDIRQLQDRDSEGWDAYVQSAPLATFFHLSGWRDVWAGVMGSQTHYLLATDGERVAGVLPLIHVKSRLAGHFLTSLPGGMCADGDEAAIALLARGRELVTETGADYLILRDGLRRWDLPGLAINDGHCTFWIDISDGVEAARARLRRNTRYYTNRGLRAGVEALSNRRALDDYYPVYAQAMRERGTPTPGQRFFEEALDRFPRDLSLLTIVHENQVLGGGFMARLRDTVFCTWSGLPRAHFDLHTSYLLQWGTIEQAVRLGAKMVDMGRCRRDSGSYQFKAGWGGEERVLYQHYVLSGIERPPRVGAGLHEDAKYRLFFNLWRRLPLWATEAIGPQLRRRMPFG